MIAEMLSLVYVAFMETKWLVTDSGIRPVTNQDPEWEDPDAPIFDNKDQAMTYMLVCLANRIDELEKKEKKK